MSNEMDEILRLLNNVNRRLDSIDSRLSKVEDRVGPLDVDTADNSTDFGAVTLNSKAPELTTPDNPNVLLCLDFGTARSKAFATDRSDEILVDVAVGQRAGSETVHSLLSCVYISDDGRIYLGETAADMSELAVAEGLRRRIDSFKSVITNAVPGTDLRAILYDPALNPTSVPLTEGDILTLYLAYLTDMAAQELVERHGLSRYVRRRFTTPVFSDKHLNWASEILKKYYAEAILVADHFSGQWQEGLPVADAYRVLRTAVDKAPSVAYLIESSMVEPVAAFASRFRHHEPTKDNRTLISIVDIGAGTTDFATFAVVEKVDKGIKMFQVPGSVHSVRKGGNELDRLLREHILRKESRRHTGIDEGVLAKIKAQLSLDQRRYKETLFREERCEYRLADDTRGEITLDEFLEDPDLKQFAADLRKEFENSLSRIAPSWITDCAQGKLVVVMTGGGAHLPMAQELGKREVTSLSAILHCESGNPIPSWVKDMYSELSGEFPQLAVAIGGASRDVPVLADEVFSGFKGLVEEGEWLIPPAYKGV